MSVHRSQCHNEADVPAARAALLGGNERQVHGVGDEVRLEQEALLFALVAEVVRLAGKTVLEIVFRVEYELDILIEVDDRGPVGHCHVARGLSARPVEMLVPGVQGDRKQGPRLPFEGDALAGVVPNRRRAEAGQYVDHFLEQLSLRREEMIYVLT